MTMKWLVHIIIIILYAQEKPYTCENSETREVHTCFTYTHTVHRRQHQFTLILYTNVFRTKRTHKHIRADEHMVEHNTSWHVYRVDHINS